MAESDVVLMVRATVEAWLLPVNLTWLCANEHVALEGKPVQLRATVPL